MICSSDGARSAGARPVRARGSDGLSGVTSRKRKSCSRIILPFLARRGPGPGRGGDAFLASTDQRCAWQP
jgi:hypothetical protein